MKKLLFFVALTSFMVSHAMESVAASGFVGQVNLTSTNRPVLIRHNSDSDIFTIFRHFEKMPEQEKGIIYVTAKTPLGTISKALSGEFIQYILYGKVNVGFNRTERTFYGIRDGQRITSPAEAQTLFNQYKEVFDATKQKNISFYSTTMDKWD
jgi:hypothetical protein